MGKHQKPTKEQRRIIHHVKGAALVDAGPGCGKTHTLKARIEKLLNGGHARPEDLLILTYNQPLTETIKRDLREVLGPRGTRITVKTFHAFGYQLVRDHHQRLGLPEAPGVVKTSCQKKLIAKIAKKLQVSPKELAKAVRAAGGQTGTAGKKSGDPLNALQQAVAEVSKRYKAQKARQGRLDYDDMIGLAVQLLKTHPDHLAGQYRHVMVDELQDIDGAQTELLLLLANATTSLVMVGDPKQSLYSYRGAEPHHWDTLKRKLKPTCFQLTQSFRLNQASLPLAMNVAHRIDPKAPTLSSRQKGPPPEFRSLRDAGAQAAFIAKTIAGLRDQGQPLSNIACLGRYKKDLSQLALALRGHGIPVIEPNWPKTERPRAMLLALLRLTQIIKRWGTHGKTALSPQEQAEIHALFDRLLLPAKTLNTLKGNVERQGGSMLLKVEAGSAHYGRVHGLNTAVLAAVKNADPEAGVQHLIDAMRPILRRRFSKSHEFHLRDLTAIKLRVRDYNSLDDVVVAELELPAAETKGVILTTCHAAKGQEWDYVFVIHVVDGVHPCRYAGKDAEKLAEEERVFFVAITRHREQLWILETPKPIRQFRHKAANSTKAESQLLEARSPFVDPTAQNLTWKPSSTRRKA